jgi:lysozyme
MLMSDRGLKLLKAFESCSLTAYPDPKSELGEACTHLGFKVTEYTKVPRWQLLDPKPVTIGWGCTGGFKLGDTIPQATADSLLRMRVHFCEYALHGIEGLNQNQFDALASLIFNIGNAAFNGSTLRKYLVLKDYHAAAGEFEKWDYASGHVVQGLLNRRKAERALFLTPIEEGAK